MFSYVYNAIVLSVLVTHTNTFSLSWDNYQQPDHGLQQHQKRADTYMRDESPHLGEGYPQDTNMRAEDTFSLDNYDPRDIRYSEDNPIEVLSPNEEYIPELEFQDEDKGYNTDHVDDYIDILKRWGNRGRYPWKRLPHRYCYHQQCRTDKDCCYSYNRCATHLRTPVCIDCWYRSICKSESDCCSKYPYCKRIWHSSKDGGKYVRTGHCVESAHELETNNTYNKWRNTKWGRLLRQRNNKTQKKYWYQG